MLLYLVGLTLFALYALLEPLAPCSVHLYGKPQLIKVARQHHDADALLLLRDGALVPRLHPEIDACEHGERGGKPQQVSYGNSHPDRPRNDEDTGNQDGDKLASDEFALGWR